jgi:hypothetical protein
LKDGGGIPMLQVRPRALSLALRAGPSPKTDWGRDGGSLPRGYFERVSDIMGGRMEPISPNAIELLL